MQARQEWRHALLCYHLCDQQEWQGQQKTGMAQDSRMLFYLALPGRM
jgi:hypothetical protein